MPVSYEYTDDGGIHVVGTGILTIVDIRELQATVYETPKHTKAIRYMFNDFTGVEHFDLSMEDMRQIADRAKDASKINPATIRVNVLPTDLGFGLGRMWEALTGGEENKVANFRDIEDAKAWLKDKLTKE